MQDTVSSSHREGHAQQTKTPRYALVVPARLLPSQCFEHKFWAAPRSKHNKDDDDDDKEADMENTACNFKGINQLPEPEVECERHNHDGNHDETCMPSLRRVGGVVENRKRSDHVCENRGWSAAGEAPSTESNPSYSCCEVGSTAQMSIAYLVEAPKNEEQQGRGWLTNDTEHLQSGLCLLFSRRS